jgi:hypothetical protein
MVRVRFRGLVGVSDPLVPCLNRRQGKVIAPQPYGRGFELNNGDQSVVADFDSSPQPDLPTTLELRLLLVHMHDAGHERMHGADVTEVAFAGKSMLEFVIGIQALGSAL